jgi:hypothetical protein
MILAKHMKSALIISLVAVAAGCTKLNENLESSLTSGQAASALGPEGTGLLLKTAYADLAGPLHSQDLLFSLQENTTDESLVATRGGDWDDNGVWRVLHSHNWDANHGQILSVFNSLNKLNFDATNVMAFNPSARQKAEATFLRALTLYYQLDLFGQYPFRNPGDDLLKPPVVKAGADAINFIITELTTALPDLSDSVTIDLASKNAARTLLMKCYLQKGAIINKAVPTFDAADMQQVITLGNQIINSGRYSYGTEYFDQFSVDKGGLNTRESIFAYPNASGVSVNHGAIEARWMMTLHYNSYTPSNPNSGWNGFATTAEFYSSFGAAAPVVYGPADAALDSRIGGRAYQGSTNISGIRPGFLVGQQFNENGVPLKDRKGNNLAYTPQINANQIETGNDLEIRGIRVVKYVPDFSSSGKYYAGPAGNWLNIFRYADVVLMVAEARMRTGDVAGGRTMVNALRAARGAAPIANLTLVNTNNVNDPNTLLSERGRELYWESVRRTDLLRFGVFLKAWGLKPADTGGDKNLLFPIPNQALAANPNLKQNPGY